MFLENAQTRNNSSLNKCLNKRKDDVDVALISSFLS